MSISPHILVEDIKNIISDSDDEDEVVEPQDEAVEHQETVSIIAPEMLESKNNKINLNNGVVVPAHMTYSLTATVDKDNITWLDRKMVTSYKTPYGLKNDVIISVIQKEVRRCRYNTSAIFMVDGIMAGEIGGAIENNIWNRSMIIAEEDIGPADPSLSIKVYELYKKRFNILEISEIKSQQGIDLTTQAQLYISTLGKMLAKSNKSMVSHWFKAVHENIGNTERKTYQDIISGLRISLRDENLDDIWYYISYTFTIKTMFGKNQLRNEVLEMLKNRFRNNDYVQIQLEIVNSLWKNISVFQKTNTVFTPIRGSRVVISGSHKKPPPELSKKEIVKIEIVKQKTDLYMDTKPLLKLATILLLWKYCQLPTNDQVTQWKNEVKNIDITKSLDVVNFYKSGLWVPHIPDYAYCMHTVKGKKMERGMRHFVEYACAVGKESNVWRLCSLEYQKLVLKSHDEFEDIFSEPCIQQSDVKEDDKGKGKDTADKSPTGGSSSSKKPRKFIKGF